MLVTIEFFILFSDKVFVKYYIVKKFNGFQDIVTDELLQ